MKESSAWKCPSCGEQFDIMIRVRKIGGEVDISRAAYFHGGRTCETESPTEELEAVTARESGRVS
jgi:hypothetical protein